MIETLILAAALSGIPQKADVAQKAVQKATQKADVVQKAHQKGHRLERRRWRLFGRRAVCRGGRCG